MGLNNKKREGTFVSIITEDSGLGMLRVRSEKGEEGAIEREYKKKDGSMATKWEIPFTEIFGKITGIEFNEGNYGRSINISIGDGKDKFILSTNTGADYGASLMKVLPNLDLSKDVTLTPYSFEDDDNNDRKGISVKQNGEKIKTFFYDIENKKNLHGIPEADEKKKPKRTEKTKWTKFWVSHFSDIEEFLVEYTSDNIIPALEKIKEKNANGKTTLKTSKDVKEELEKTDPLDDF